ncbi:mitogen-activated protein kinase 15-like [Gigantopelta aegis]|uniref:mitogen-activated protein kinase 15-like n=1 Tax=Gigantopelta aegis TaxID=1735272 RepID=UPI001B889ABF|nr:mitogen-activated protein kinase 15-like [Gigantopelta aegis]
MMLYFSETDLHNVIKRGNILKDVHKRYIMYQLFKATKYLHSGNVIHRDQKPSNILLDSECVVKLCDFGLARSLTQIGMDETGDPNLTEYVATRWYRAPEILLASHKYTKGVDMWSLGCILGEMLLGKPVFPGTSTLNQIERIMSSIATPSRADIDSIGSAYGTSVLEKACMKGRKKFEDLIPDAPADGLDLMKRLLHFNPDKRVTAEEALKHPYVERFHNPSEEHTLDYDVVPPISDETQLTVDEYRSKLYEMIMQKKAERRRRRREEAQKAQKAVQLAQIAQRTQDEIPPAEPEVGMEENSPKGVSPKSMAKHVSAENYRHQSSFTGVAFGRTTHDGHHKGSKTVLTRQRSYEHLQGPSNNMGHEPYPPIGMSQKNRQTSAPPAAGLRGRPISGTYARQGNPMITRDDRSGLTVTSSRMVPGQRPTSANVPRPKPLYGRKQFSNAVNHPSVGAHKATFGSYTQSYGTISSSGLAALQTKKT